MEMASSLLSTYTHGMYTRFPSITSISWSPLMSSCIMTSAFAMRYSCKIALHTCWSRCFGSPLKVCESETPPLSFRLKVTAGGLWLRRMPKPSSS